MQHEYEHFPHRSHILMCRVTNEFVYSNAQEPNVTRISPLLFWHHLEVFEQTLGEIDITLHACKSGDSLLHHSSKIV